jgi:hypothetical protein
VLVVVVVVVVVGVFVGSGGGSWARADVQSRMARSGFMVPPS